MKDPFDKRVFLFDMCEIYGNIKENKLKTKKVWKKFGTRLPQANRGSWVH